MFKSLIILHCFVLILVKTNPLQGFPSYPITQYQESYKNEQPILLQSSNFNSYPHVHLIQNQLTPYNNIHIPYNDYVSRVYVENVLQNEINSALQANYDTNSGLLPQFINAADLNLPQIINNYYIVPVEHIPDNIITDTTKVKCDIKEDLNSECGNGDKKKKKKCKKRKNETKSKKRHKSSQDEEKDVYFGEKVTKVSKVSNQDVNPCKKSKSRNKSHRSNNLKEEASSVGNENLTKDKNSKCENYQNNKNRNSHKKVTCNDLISQDHEQKNGKCMIKDKKTDRNCRKRITYDDDSYNHDRILNQDCVFDINEECGQNDNRCTRNYKKDDFRGYEQQYRVPSDISNNMFPYMMFNQPLFDVNGYYPFNFDNFYNNNQYPNDNFSQSQNKPKSSKRTRRKKQKKENKNKKNGERNITESKQSCPTVEITPTVVEFATNHENTNKPVAQIEDKLCKVTSHEVLDSNNQEKDVPFSDHHDLKETTSNNCLESIYDDISAVYDDYYPEFHSHNVYTSTSKEEFDWNTFNDRHYYSSSDTDELGSEGKKPDSLDHTSTEIQDKIKSIDDLQQYIPITNNEKKEEESINKRPLKLTNNKEIQCDGLETFKEEIQFKTPPALDFPDFKTEMINKDEYTPTYEVYYRPNDKATNSKMSSYSNTKNVESDEKRNKIVDKNDIETVFVNSKVVKYGTPSSKEEILSANDYEYNDEEFKVSTNKDGEPFIVIAKSLPYPIP